MRLSYPLYIVGALLCVIALTMLFPIGTSLYYADSGLKAFSYAFICALILGLGLMGACSFNKKNRGALSHKEGMLIVSVGWLGTCLVGALPFYFWGFTASDAVFEAFSGFTSTGATILGNIEALPQSILLWRGLANWLGGMGIIVFSIAILPFFGVGGMELYKAEVPGPTPDKLSPRIKDTAATLWRVYLLLSALMFFALVLADMPLFDSIVHTFSALSTGGFSSRNASIGAYNSAAIEWICILFMFLGGTSFTLHYKALRGDIGSFWRSTEFKIYLFMLLAGTAIIAFSTYGKGYASLTDAIRLAAFHVVSICTSTGFAAADYESWSPATHAVLMIFTFTGACAGSTSGGIKWMRIIILFKFVYADILRLIHPHAVIRVKLDNASISHGVIGGVLSFFVLYLGLVVIVGLILSLLGIDMLTSFTAAAACFGNVGPAFGTVGPAENFGHLPDAAKYLLSLCMLLGRLELYAIFLLFVPEFWRK